MERENIEKQPSCEYRLWSIKARLYAIGELVKHQGGEPPLNATEVNFGLGEIITGIADELGGLGESE